MPKNAGRWRRERLGLQSLHDPVDTTTPQGRLTFNLFASRLSLSVI